MSITPKAIQDLLDELEASKQRRLRAWNVLQRLRSLLSELANVAIPPRPRRRSMRREKILEHAFDFEPPMIIILREDQNFVFYDS
jgi:hypothetical protein